MRTGNATVMEGARFAREQVPHPQVLHRWWRSRLGAAFVRELALVGGLLVAYKYGRFVARDEAARAFEHARELIQMERALSIFTEARLQAVALGLGDDVLRALNAYYLYAHVLVTAVVFVWLFLRHPSEYLRFRRVMILMTVSGLALHFLLPLAPPRMFPHLGFVDTGRLVGPASYGTGSAYHGFANEFAAMPSLHFGWALATAWAACITVRSRWRFVSALHPVLTLAAVVMTANHFWLDTAAAALLFVAGLELDHWRRRRTRSARATTGQAEADAASSAVRTPSGMLVDSWVPGVTDT